MKRNVTRLLTVLLVLLIPVSLVVARGNEQNKAGTATKKVDIAMVTFMTGIPYFDEAAKGAFRAGQKLGVEVGYFGPPSNDTAGEIALIDDLITQGIKGMIVTAMDSKAVVPVLQKAMNAGIKVVTFDLDTDPAG
ncbi:MAG: substrate-binding domain-containing protein, partial [Treponema sp.]|nr:substrate-binding domain-containing protein [Treponema sp.]